MRSLISTVLDDAGYEVSAAADGQQAWESILRDHYDLLLTDNEMPRLAGVALIERIREAGMSLPIIIASGTFPAERVRNNPQLRVAAVLPKPFHIRSLVCTVRNVLQASSGNTGSGQGTSIGLTVGRN